MISIPPNTLKIIIVISLAIIFGIIIITVAKSFASTCGSDMTYDTTLKKCRPKCKDNETYYDDVEKCLPCPVGQSLFGTVCRTECSSDQSVCGDYCYDPAVNTCINNQLCTRSMSCVKNTQCCQSGEHCDSATDTCIDCDSTLQPCGATCCPSDKPCVGGVCCDGTKCGDTCCDKKRSCCGGNCCNSDEVCDPSGTKCLTQCGEKTCDPKNEVCVKIKNTDGTTLYNCSNNSGCDWDTLNYEPQNIQGKAVCNTSDNKIVWCKNASGTVQPYSRTSTDIKLTNSTCSVGDCYAKLNEKGLQFLSWDGNECKGSFDCQTELNSCDNKCPFQDTSQCCTDPTNTGKFTGQVCADGQHCYNQNGTNICSRGWTSKQDPAYSFPYNKCVLIDPNDTTNYKSVADTEAKCNQDSPQVPICDIPPPTGPLNGCENQTNIKTNVSCEQQQVAPDSAWLPPGICFSSCNFTKHMSGGLTQEQKEMGATTKYPIVVKTKGPHKFNAGGYTIGGDAFVPGSNTCPTGSYFYTDVTNKKAICSTTIDNMEKNLTSVAGITMATPPQKSYFLKTC